MKLPSKNSRVLVGVGATPKELVACRDWALNCQRGTIDVSTIGTEWKEFLAGQIQADGSVTLLFDPDNDSSVGAVEDAMFEGEKLTFYIRPEGSAVGSLEYQLEAFVTTYNITGATDDAIQVAVSFTGAGPIVKGVVA